MSLPVRGFVLANSPVTLDTVHVGFIVLGANRDGAVKDSLDGCVHRLRGLLGVDELEGVVVRVPQHDSGLFLPVDHVRLPELEDLVGLDGLGAVRVDAPGKGRQVRSVVGHAGSRGILLGLFLGRHARVLGAVEV